MIAEGIETPEMLTFVQRAGLAEATPWEGIRGVQGYLLGRPSATIPPAVAVPRAFSA